MSSFVYHSSLMDADGQLRPKADVVAAFVGDDAVLLSTANGVYYSLNEIATVVWRLSVEGRTLGEIHRAVQEQYDVDATRLEGDLDHLAGEWARLGLIDAPA